VDHFADLRNAAEGDPSPRSDAKLEVRKTVEIGHVFKLGTKYSDAMGAKFLDDTEQQHTIIMGCYGIGVNRILASLIETKSDANGIVWPMSIAPYEVIVSSVNAADAEVAAASDKLYGELQALGIDVLYDDRDQRPGVKFKDADLIGVPLRVVVGGRGLKDGNLELKWRTKEAAEMIPLAGAAEAVAKLVAAERAKYK
ncbi:MAG: proline--tRNA ligase, partial [Planctomycetaceae bacterium]|nr:proline--tRNA ligase [Planctomycetaceae bacterium]